MLCYAAGSPELTITDEQLSAALTETLRTLGPHRRILIIPPDMTRYHSRAGKITAMLYQEHRESIAAVMPALGTHYPMTEEELNRMYPGVPHELFVAHDWRNDVITLGELSAEEISRLSGGKADYAWPVQVNRLLVDGGFDLIISVGQVVPHEVIGMANYTKNILVGTGGSECINKSHFLGAVCDMETILGKPDNPVREAVDTGFSRFLSSLPVLFIQTVIGTGEDGATVLRGLYIGDDRSCFEQAAELSQKINITVLDDSPETVVTYLDPEEFKSTWLGNKSIYRTRMAIADGGRLIVLAPGVSTFGEDRDIDRLIRAYGYCGTERVLELTASHEDLQQNLSAAAHLIHGSTEGRFSVTYCPGGLSREEVEQAGYEYGDAARMMEKYRPEGRLDGWYPDPDGQGKDYYFIANPALGLWTARERFFTQDS